MRAKPKTTRKPRRKPKRAPQTAARKVARRKTARRKASGAGAARRTRAARKQAAGARPRRKTAGKASRPRPAKRAAVAPPGESFPQRAGASPKQLVMFELVRARAALHAAIQGFTPGAANQPMADGAWSARETVLHLVNRDQARLRELERVLLGAEPSWRAADDARMSEINAELLGPVAHLDWEEAVRLMHRTRRQLMEAIESVPEGSTEVWVPDHPFGWMLHGLPPHDRHHAEIIKRWRRRRGA